MLERFLRERNIGATRRPHLARLIRALDEHIVDVDQRLERALTNWRLDRLSSIDRNILRLGATELSYIADVPDRVAIQEAIILAEKYGTAESPRFVNGVLDALMHGGGDEPDDRGGAR